MDFLGVSNKHQNSSPEYSTVKSLKFMREYLDVSRSDFNLFSKNNVVSNPKISERCARVSSTAASSSGGTGSYLSPHTTVLTKVIRGF
jgi:hypothetical protein